MPFHLVIRQALVGGNATIALSPSILSGRLLIEADAWAHFKVAALKFRLHPTTTPTGDQAAGFVGGVQDTPPATIVQVMELLPSTLQGLRATIPSNWVRVPRSDLAGPFPWYKSVNGTADPTEEAPGVLVVSGTGTDAFALEISLVVQFKTAVSSGNTPMAFGALQALRMERVLLARDRERAALVGVLGGQPILLPPTPTPVVEPKSLADRLTSAPDYPGMSSNKLAQVAPKPSFT